MTAISADLDQLRQRFAAMMQSGQTVEDVIESILQNPQAHVIQEDDKVYTLMISPDKTSYQMRDSSGKILDEQPLQNPVTLLLQSLASSQLSELLLQTKVDEYDTVMQNVDGALKKIKAEMQEINEFLEKRGLPTEVDGQSVKLIDRIKRLYSDIPTAEHPAGFAHEEMENLHSVLDKEGVGRKNNEGTEDLSILGRVMIFANNVAQKREKILKHEFAYPAVGFGSSNVMREAARAEMRMIEGAAEVSTLTSPLEVIVTGYTYTGKTVVMAIFEQALRRAGFTNVVFMNAEESPQMRAEILARMENKENQLEHFAPEFFDKQIRISEANVPRTARPMKMVASPQPEQKPDVDPA